MMTEREAIAWFGTQSTPARVMANKAWQPVDEEINARASDRKGMRSFEVHHERMVAMTAFVDALANNKTFGEAQDAARASIKLDA